MSPGGVAGAAEWYLALTLAERAGLPGTGPRTVHRGEKAAAAARRLDRWRALPPFAHANGERWRRRLATDGLDEQRLLALLAEAPSDLARRAAPVAPLDWLHELAAIYGRGDGTAADAPTADAEAADAAAGDAADDAAASDAAADAAGGFLDLLAPLLGDARARLAQRLEPVAAAAPDFLPGAAETADLLLPHLAGRLKALLARTLVLELHIAGLEGLLGGASPEDRFQCFRQRLRRPKVALDLLRHYPVLARQAIERAAQWVSAAGELIERLAADRQRLCDAFSPDADLGLLVEVKSGAGDPHRGGRTVTTLRFAAGRQLVYKPKPMAVEAAFQRLLRWLNAHGFEPRLGTLRVEDRGAYGWVEHASHQMCSSAAAVERFYERLGGLLAVLYALDAGDMHSENLIAAGEDPILVDLEALFHPSFDDMALAAAAEGSPPAADGGAVTPPAWRSVLRVGLLPNQLWADDEQPGIDVSGLGGAPGQTTPRPVLQLLDAGTDQMRFTRRRVELPGAANRPALPDAEIHPHHHADAIAAGFARAYRLLAAHRDELLAAGGPVDAFGGGEVRVLLRPTLGYVTLLTESFHPDVLGDALRRDQLFDRLWGGISELPRLPSLIAAERQDLEHGDVPIFTTRPDSRDLWTSNAERLPALFAASGRERVREHIGRLDEADLLVQEWTLRGTLAALALSAGAFRPAPHRVAAASTPAGRGELLAAARAAGDRLAALASRDGERAFWFGLGPTADARWVFGPLQADLYSGLPGIALFLAHLGAASGEARFTGLARAAMASLRPLLRGETAPLPLLGAFGGWGGLIYTLVHLGRLWHDPELLPAAESCLAMLAPQIAVDEHLDLLDGAAGCLAGILALHREHPATATLAAARACGDHLLARAEPQPAGLAWRVPAGPRPLTGFAHGTAGIAWALAGLAAVTRDRRYRDGARAGLRFERSVYSPELRGWPDLRDEEQQRGWAADEERAARAAAAAAAAAAGEAAQAGDPLRAAAAAHAAGDAAAAADAARAAGSGEARLCAWCHGATGIGFSRLGLLELSHHPRRGNGRDAGAERLTGEIGIAVAATLADGFGRDHSLCHGDLGSLDFLLTAARRLGDREILERTYRLAGGVLSSIVTGGWRFGVASGAEPPGLMVGLSGIGYGLLRLAFPERVPSVLLLELPPAATG